MEERQMEKMQRLNRLQDILRERGLSGAILFHSRDLFYYSGTAQPAFLLALPDDYSLFVRRGFETARRETFLEAGKVVTGKDPTSIFSRMFPGAGSGERVGTEMDLIPFALASQFKHALGDRELVDVSGDILSQRMVKDSLEIQSIRKACAAIHAGHLAAMAALSPGITELELAAAVENAQRLSGHEGCFFVRSNDFVMSRGPLASGPNLKETSGTLFTLSGAGLSSAIPTGPGARRMERGDLVLVDIPACIEGYHADQSRTYCIGEPSAEEADLFGRLREVSDCVIRSMTPGVPCSELFRLAQSSADDLGIGDAFMRFDSGAKAHFIGHGIGLELNEHPILTAKSTVFLKDRTVIALEMHIVKKDGPALKLEDTVLVTAEGGEILTQSPRHLIAADTFRANTLSAGFHGTPKAW